MASGDDVPDARSMFTAKIKTRRADRSRQRSLPALPGLFDALPEFSLAELARTRAEERVVVAAPSAPPQAEHAAPVLSKPNAVATVWTVSALLREVREQVEQGFARLTIEGEISNWRKAASGHCYFTLKDGDAQISVVMFRREAALLRFAAKDGDAVRLRGSLSVYEARGQMQIVAEHMQLAGLGALLAAVQELKERLKREGIFANKRALPAFPKCIGVVTSLQGAALRDIVKICRRRHAAVNLLVYPASVQGPRCAAEVAAGVHWFSTHSQTLDTPGCVDVVLVARGGGSWEDLHGFDDESVARAIAACAVPVIVGVGHATDSVIADSAADVCAPTPSAAAELLTATQYKVEQRVEALAMRVRRGGGYEVLRARQRLSRLSTEAVLRRIRDGLARRAQRLDELIFRAESAVARTAKRKLERMTRVEARLSRQDVKFRVAAQQAEFAELHGRLRRVGSTLSTQRLAGLEHLMARAEAMSPLRVLDRGYALVYGPRGELLRSADAVRVYDTITARLASGSLRAKVDRVSSDEGTGKA